MENVLLTAERLVEGYHEAVRTTRVTNFEVKRGWLPISLDEARVVLPGALIHLKDGTFYHVPVKKGVRKKGDT